jgi:hypothetical protein
MPQPRPRALVVARLKLAAGRGARAVHGAGYAPADLTLERTAARLGPVGARHAGKVSARSLDERVREPAVGRFRPVERDAEAGAARAASLTDFERLVGLHRLPRPAARSGRSRHGLHRQLVPADGVDATQQCEPGSHAPPERAPACPGCTLILIEWKSSVTTLCANSALPTVASKRPSGWCTGLPPIPGK